MSVLIRLRYLIFLILMGCSNPSVVIVGDRVSVFTDFETIKVNEKANLEGPFLGESFKNSHYTHPGKNEKHSGGHLEGPSSEMEKLWTLDIGRGVTKTILSMSEIVGSENKIAALDTDSVVTVVDKNEGNVIWKKKVGDRLNSYASISGGLVIYKNFLFIQTGDLDLSSYNLENGEEIWRKSFILPIIGGPTASNSGVAITLIDGSIHFLNIGDGSTLWETIGRIEQDGIIGSASPSISDDLIIVPGSGGDLSILNANDGSFLWGDNLASLTPKTALEEIADIRAHPVISGDNIFAISQSGRLVTYSKEFNSMLWELKVSGVSMPWIAGDSLFLITDKPELICIRIKDGEIRWISNLPGIKKGLMKSDKFITHYGPVVASKKVYVSGGDGFLRVFDSINGDLLNEFKTSSKFSTSPIIMDKAIYILTDDAKLTAYK